MIRHHVRFAFYLGAVLLVVPTVLISEQANIISETSTTPPLEVLLQSTPLVDNTSSILLKLANTEGAEVSSPCSNNFSIVHKNENHTIIQWKNAPTCKVQLITFNKTNYIVPLSDSLPSLSTLSDISDETLKNTLRASSLIRNDFRISSTRLQEFFHNIETILEARRTPFTLPMTGISLPTSATFLPNAPRPYRAKLTDGIHHGWDFYTKSGTPVKAIEDGTIIHIKRDFHWDEMNNLQAGITDLEKQVNLDTYRGNTVYLKTLSGHVAIYAHLGNIPTELHEGSRVSRGTILGEVGDSAVPGKEYLYHLHFEIAMNPFNEKKAGNNSFEDILLWSFWGKGKKMDWIKNNDELLFE